MEVTAVTAFQPVIVEGDAVRLNPFVCRWLNADYDGDLVAVLAPRSREAVAEAQKLLSVVGHITADARCLDTFAPTQEAMWGLSLLWDTDEGRQALANSLPALPSYLDILTRNDLVSALRDFLTALGAKAAVKKTVELWELGFTEAQKAGGALQPFEIRQIDFPGKPESDDRAEWERYAAHCEGSLASRDAFTEPLCGPQLVAARVGARGSERGIVHLSASRGFLIDKIGRTTIIKKGLLFGLSFEELYALAVHNHEGIVEMMEFWKIHRHPGFPHYQPYSPVGTHVIVRAMRSPYPGIVFAHAANSGEMDPLIDDDARLFLGMLPKERS